MATAAPSEAAAPAKSKGKKILVILVALLLVLAIGGGAGLYFLKQKQQQAQAALEEEEFGDAPAKPAARSAKDKPAFLTLDMFTVNLADRDFDRYAQAQVVLELRDEKSAELMKTYMPVIRSRVLSLMTQKTSQELLERYGKERLAREIRASVAKALNLEPPEVVEDPLPPLPGAAPAEPEKKAEPPRRRRAPTDPERISPVVAVHFANFIIQ